jgi:hypothetical protein
MLPWIAVAFFIEKRAVRPRDVSLTSLTLIGVSDTFVIAVGDQQQAKASPRPVRSIFVKPRQHRAAWIKESVRVTRREALAGNFPAVCAACGAPAVVRRTKEFTSSGLFAETGMRVTLPFCHNHRNHWANRVAYLWCLFFLTIFLWVAALVLMIPLIPGKGIDHSGAGWSCLALMALGIVWLIVAAGIRHSPIRATGITDHSITLHNLSAVFVDALDPDYVIASPSGESTNQRPARTKDLMGPPEPGNSEEIFDPKHGTDIRPGGEHGPGSP